MASSESEKEKNAPRKNARAKKRTGGMRATKKTTAGRSQSRGTAASRTNQNGPARRNSRASGRSTAKRSSQRNSGRGRTGRAGSGYANRNRTHTGNTQKKKDDVIPSLPKDTIRVIPLGGVEEIGKNMTAIEYGDDIVVVDCGFQFREQETPGIDYILPNTKYLEDRKEKVRALVITHGHLDHIGAIPYVMDRIDNPPIYSRQLTNVMVKKRQEEFPDKPALDIKDIEANETIRLSDTMSVRFFNVSHSIPDSMGLIITTPHGDIVVTGDIRVDHADGTPTEEEQKEFKQFEKMNILMMLADSTNIEKPGWSIPESQVEKTLERIIKETKSRLIIGTFASQLDRIIKIIESAEKHGKKVVIDGRSMKNNIEIVKQLGILKTKKETLIPIEEMEDYPPDRVLALVTGAQGDEFAALMRMANKNHKFFKLSSRDTVLLSSSIIPGNEKAVQRLKDNIARQGARIIHSQIDDVHASGHANQEEMKWVHKQVQPKFFMPQHGYHYMLRVHADIAHQVGTPRENIVVPDNGTIVEIRDKGSKLVRLKETAPASIRMVDGFSIGDIQDVVIRDRKALAQDGMFVVIASINLKTGKLKKSPDIVSRGFVYLRESQDLLQQTRLIIKKTIEKRAAGMNPVDIDYIKDAVTDEVAKFLFQQTNKHPIVIPVLIGV